jgi:hypothetical protein
MQTGKMKTTRSHHARFPRTPEADYLKIRARILQFALEREAFSTREAATFVPGLLHQVRHAIRKLHTEGALTRAGVKRTRGFAARTAQLWKMADFSGQATEKAR